MKTDHLKKKLRKEEQSSDLKKVPKKIKQAMKGSARMSSKKEIDMEMQASNTEKARREDLDELINQEANEALDCHMFGICKFCDEVDKWDLRELGADENYVKVSSPEHQHLNETYCLYQDYDPKAKG